MTSNWLLYRDENLLNQVSFLRADGNREMLLRVDGLRCGACVRRLEQELPAGAFEARADLSSGSCELAWDPQRTDLPQILAAVEQAGFAPVIVADDAQYRQVRAQRRAALARIGVALLFGMQLMMLASGEYLGEVDATMRPLLRYAQWLLASPVALYAGWPFLAAGWRSLWARAPTMDAPVALAISVAYVASAVNTVLDSGHVYFDSVAMFVLLLSLARFWEQKGRAQAADRLRRLAATQAFTAQRQDENGIDQVAVSELREGNIIVVAPGQAAAADGELLVQAAEFDESLLTGEAVPQARQVGETICAGSVVCGCSPVRLRVLRTGAATTLSQITRLVHRALAARPRVQIWADRLAGRFVLAVLVIASASFLGWLPDTERAFEVGLAVLVVTCPCALSLATPMALAAAVTRLSKDAVLLVRADALMRLPSIDTVCLDKTGTLTTRGMRIVQCQLLADLSEAEARAIAAALESGLDHPIARAFGQPQAGLAEQVRVEPGRGVFGQVDGQDYALTNCEPVAAGGCSAEPLQRWFVLSRGGRELARFALAEELRPGARQAVRALRRAGLDVHLLSGDSPDAARSLAAFLDIPQAHGEQTPASKLDYVRALQNTGHRVLAVGDGINDGPLLAGADASVGIASGAALAQAHGDAILMSDDLAGLARLIAVAGHARRIVYQNLAWALGYNLTLVPLAVLGHVTPWLAALGMGASSLWVTLNALRLLRVDARDPHSPKTLGVWHEASA